MDEKELPIFEDEQDTTSPSVIPGQHTETIELSALFSKTVTISGTFDLDEQQASSLGKLLHALPLPSLVIDRSFRIGFANKSCRKISPEYRKIVGDSLSSIFPDPAAPKKVESMVERIFLTRKPQMAQAIVGVGKNKMFGRLNFRHLKIGETHSVLLIIEDLTLEKRQLLLNQKHHRELERAQNELEHRVKERTAELKTINEILQREIGERKRAEKELETELNKFQVLYDVAVAMTAERNLEQNLALVVEKSRELLAADTAYIALPDEETGSVCMHTLSGIDTEAFKKMRMPFGSGLGGKVAATGRGYIVSDYFQEIEPLVHDIVRAEGLISGMAVPIQIGYSNLGVLYVFNRTKGSYSDSDLRTLSLLGNLAAIEISRKRAESDLRESRDELEERVIRRTAELAEINKILQTENSERQAAQEALRHSEEMLSNILSASPMGIAYFEKGKLRWSNQAMSTIFGYEGDKDYIGKKPKDFFYSEEEYASVRELFFKNYQEKKPAETEAKFRRVDGSSFYGKLRMSVLDSANPRKGTISTVTDISARKMAEESLQESRERYRTLVEDSFDGIFVQQGARIVFANSRLYRMLGYEEGELKGVEHWCIYHPDFQVLIRERAEARMRGEDVPAQDEVKLLRKDGSSFDGEINARTVSLGTESGIQVWVRDITGRKLAEAALRESEEKYRTIIESIEEAYYEVDPAGYFTFLNDAAVQMLGYERDEILGKHYEQILNPDNGA